MLNLDSTQEKQQRLARDACSQPQPSISESATTGGVPPGQRSGWGLGQAGLQQKQQGPSLMEQMMEEAAAAKEEQAKETRKKQQRETKTTFAKGLKKGFLAGAGGGASGSSTARRKSRTGGKKGKEEAPKGGSSGSSSTISSSSNGGVSQSSSSVAPAAGGNASMPVITGRTASSGGLEFDVSAKADATNTKSGLILPEVQAAMESSTNALGGGGGGGAAGDWLTPELLDKISEKPRLAAMLSDPRFSKAMQLMATSPKDALGMFASSPEARDSFTELMALLADHFTGMGKAADKQAEEEEADRKKVADGPLAQEALRRAAEGVGVAASPATGEEKAKVDSVLQQPELRELLMDPGMQRVLQECGDPSALARYMRHPEFGPKLQLMARAGLVSFRS